MPVGSKNRSQRIDVREDGAEKVRAESRQLLFVKVKTVDEIVLGVIENFDGHDTRLRMSALACSQSEKRASPALIRRSLIENLAVPLGQFECIRGTTQVRPKSLHQLELLGNGHFIERQCHGHSQTVTESVLENERGLAPTTPAQPARGRRLVQLERFATGVRI